MSPEKRLEKTLLNIEYLADQYEFHIADEAPEDEPELQNKVTDGNTWNYFWITGSGAVNRL